MRRILLENIASGMKLAKPLYSADGRILLNAGLELKESYIERLHNLDVSYIYVEDDLTADIEVPDVVSEQARVEAVSTAKTIMDNVKLGKKVDAAQAKKIANNLVDELCRNHGVMVNFVDMRTRSDYLFSHSVSVCILSVLTGISLGYDELKLRDLGVGALLHDVGKTQIAPEILNKTERLSPEEAEEIKQHPAYGFEILRKNPDISLMSAHCAFQHHERFDGSGYPRNLKDAEIHQFAHIVAIADVYDALTSDVAYRRAVPVYEALAIINQASGTYFNPELIEHFVGNIAVYPIGSVVRLSNNQIGVVVDISHEAKNKPVIRILMDENKQRMNKLVEIDLSKNPRLYIADVVER
ncbi:MAG TPA: HD-GYP domain-containing protein [Selenomonadales bacterium]|nr:HD-GYP domain-containing protein [Selenomonadales bacterium]